MASRLASGVMAMERASDEVLISRRMLEDSIFQRRMTLSPPAERSWLSVVEGAASAVAGPMWPGRSLICVSTPLTRSAGSAKMRIEPSAAATANWVGFLSQASDVMIGREGDL